jgi:hypothetical protein
VVSAWPVLYVIKLSLLGEGVIFGEDLRILNISVESMNDELERNEKEPVVT